jgi:phosphatidylserine decarboxylase
MRRGSIELCLEGLPLLAFLALAALTLALLGWPVPALAALLACVFTLYFFRDPQRVVPQAEGLAVSPADGKVIAVDRSEEPFTGDEARRVSIFMNVFNVHVNRSPVQGEVIGQAYIPGKFFNASRDKASAHNERHLLRIIDAANQSWTVVQIAGLVARRIVSWSGQGEVLQRGARLGLIKFGSRVDLYVPASYEIVVKPGQKVLAGCTVLAEMRQ